MKRTILYTLFLVSLFSTASAPAEAQFFKKLFGGREQKKKPSTPNKPVKKSDSPATTKQSKSKKKHFDYPATVIKQRYRIDVLIPLYLAETVKDDKAVSRNNIPEKAVAGVNFYEGVKIASDSLTRLGYQADIFVHDVTDPALTPDALVKNDILEESDLIIGALPSSQLSFIADYAAKRHINFVSALSPSDGDVTNNPYFTVLQPSLQHHCKAIRDIAFKKYPDEVPYLIYRKKVSVDSLAYSYFVSDSSNLFRKVVADAMPAREQIERFVDANKTNVVFMAIVDASYAESILHQIKTWFPDYRFEVYGMPSWKSMPSLRKPDAYPNIAVNFTAPFYFDPSAAMSQSLANHYKREFGLSRPNEMVYRGYETMFWYTTLLNKYGTIFNAKNSDNTGALFTKFQVKPQWTNTDELQYNSNEHTYHYRYQGGSYLVQQ